MGKHLLIWISPKKLCARMVGIAWIGWCLLGFVHSASGTQLSIPEIHATAREVVRVPIMIDRVKNLAGIKLTMTYDPQILTFKKADKSSRTAPMMHVVNNKIPGTLTVVMAGPKGIRGKDFPLILLTFQVSNKLSAACKTWIRFTEIQLMDSHLKWISATFKARPIHIEIETITSDEK